MVAEETVDVWVLEMSPCGLEVSWQVEHSLLAGTELPEWQTRQEVRTTPATVVVALEWMALRSAPLWQPE